MLSQSPASRRSITTERGLATRNSQPVQVPVRADALRQRSPGRPVRPVVGCAAGVSSAPVSVTISEQPSGAVVATARHQLAHELLKHAGFTRHADWYGVVAPASLSPDAPLVDRLRGAQSGAELSGVLVELLDQEQGMLIRLQEALEAAGEVSGSGSQSGGLRVVGPVGCCFRSALLGQRRSGVGCRRRREGRSSAARASCPAAVRSALPPGPSVEAGPASGVRASPVGGVEDVQDAAASGDRLTHRPCPPLHARRQG